MTVKSNGTSVEWLRFQRWRVPLALWLALFMVSFNVYLMTVVIVPIADIHRGTLRALKYAKRLAGDVRAVCIVTSPEQEERIRQRWARFPEVTIGIELVVIAYDFRDILTPLITYIEHVNSDEYPDRLITVVIPEFVPNSVAANLLHNQTANILRFRLYVHENIVVINVPYHIQRNHVENGIAEPETWVSLQ